MYVEKKENYFFIEIVDLQASEDDIKADLLLKIEVEEGKMNLIRSQFDFSNLHLLLNSSGRITMMYILLY